MKFGFISYLITFLRVIHLTGTLLSYKHAKCIAVGKEYLMYRTIKLFGPQLHRTDRLQKIHFVLMLGRIYNLQSSLSFTKLQKQIISKGQTYG